MGRILLVVGLTAFLTAFSSCVSKEKYLSLEARATNHEMENRQLRARVQELEAGNKKLSEQSGKQVLTKDSELKALNNELQKKIAALEEMNRKIQELEAELQAQEDTAAAVVSETSK